MAVNFQGQVTRMFVNASGCHVRLEGRGDGYFRLLTSHTNYNAIYALILTAAANRFVLRLRTQEEREDVTADSAQVLYAVIDW